ncbi:MAG: hypothetical protein ACOX86_08790 [Pelotomaculaceae bacterium]|nr:hypothetical protein [Bacillota bacterium]HHU87369.1 hypothetical protein [Peptococcaceae bacterium]
MNQQSAAGNNSFRLPLMVVVLEAFAAILNNSSINVALPKFCSLSTFRRGLPELSRAICCWCSGS